MKKYVFLLPFFILWAPLSAEASTIRISDPRIELELAPGETYAGEIIAENPEDEELKTRIYLEDWAYIPGGTGEKKFMPAASTPLSSANWITFTPTDDVFKPFGRITARYTISVPKDATGTHYAVLFFESILGTVSNEEGANVLVAGRIGALFFIQVKGTVQRRGEVGSVKVEPPQGNKPMEIRTEFSNKGNVDITLAGNLLIMDTDGQVLGRGDLAKIYTFPGSTESGVTQWVGRLPKGQYQLLLTYDLGKGKTEVREETLNIP